MTDTAAIQNFVPTMHLRWHKHVTGQVWSTKWENIYTMTLEQCWVGDRDGRKIWKTLPVFTTEAKNQTMRG